MRRLALTIEFDGGPFMGWQRQVHGPSVQQAVEEAIAKITGESAQVYSAGRTDAGVHAIAMQAHCDIASALTPFRLTGAINAHLRPAPIAILGAREVAPDWHARFSCEGRGYVYRVINRRAQLTIDAGRAWRITQPLNVTAMQVAARRLLGRHDFTTFRSAHCQADSPVRTLDRLDVTKDGDRIAIHAEARSFLHHQVRSMVGCLVEVGLGKWSVDDLSAALEARDRTALAMNAPADGLYFAFARYPD